MDFQSEKKTVRDYHAALDRADFTAAAQHVTQDCSWRGYHPFNEMTGADPVAEHFWTPLHASLTGLKRREDIFFAGLNQIDGFHSRWVVSMGHLTGLFDAPWLGIPPTGRMAFLRYATFCRVEGGRISAIAMFIDIPHLMIQAGLDPFPKATAAHLVQPGRDGHERSSGPGGPPVQASAAPE